MDKKEIWKNVLSCLEAELSKPTIAAFFGHTELGSFESGVAKVLCPSHLSAEYLKTRYQKLITEVLGDLSGQSCRVSFEIKPLPPTKSQTLGPIFKTREQDGLVPSYTFENFVIGFSNQLAVSVAQVVTENPGKLHNPLFLHSSVGLGKTHLLHAIGHAIKEQDQEATVLYSPTERFTNEMVRAIQDRRSMSSFRKKFRSVDVLLVDDTQFLAGRVATQEEFFNTFNELYLAGKQIILTSDRRPSEIKQLEDRLVSRFSGGMVIDIQEPDLDMRAEILRRKAAARGANLQEETILLLAEQISGSVRQLEGVLNQLLTIAAAQNTVPSPELVNGVLASLPQPKRFISPEGILTAVCQKFNLKPEVLRSPKRTKEVVRPRQITAYLLRNLSQISLQQIGELLGGRDHSTILHSLGKIEEELTRDPFLRSQVEALRAELSPA